MPAAFSVRRGRTILAVADYERSLAFYRDDLGFDVETLYDDPPYATLRLGDLWLSLAEQGHEAEDRPGVLMRPPADPASLPVALVLETDDCAAAHDALSARGAQFLAPPYRPPWGGMRFFVRDPDGYLVEVEEPAA